MDLDDIFNQELPLNPFEPEREVSPELFSGRAAELLEMRRLIVDVTRGRGRGLAIIGERGMGKTSLVNYVARRIPDFPDFDDDNPAPLLITASLGSCSNIADVCQTLLDELFAHVQVNKGITGALKKLLSTLDSVSVAGVGVKLRNGGEDSKDLVLFFHRILKNALDVVMKEFGGLVFVLDETERIAELEAFPFFLKTTTEQLRRDGGHHVGFVLNAIPEAWNRMGEHNPSFLRMFHILELAPMTGEDVSKLISRALERGRPHKTSDGSLEAYLYRISEGIPSFVHHFGYCAFEQDEDGTLDRDDVSAGFDEAMRQLEAKFFSRLYIELVQSNSYREILRAMAKHEDHESIPLSFVRENVQNTKPESVSTYVGNMVKRGVVKKVPGKRGYYALPSFAFRVFLLAKDSEKRQANG